MKKALKISFLSCLSALFLTILAEFLRRNGFAMSVTETIRNIFLALTVIFGALSLCFLLSARIGVPKAIVCTVAVMSALGFLVGAALIAVSMRVDPSVLGITQIGAIYCYLLGIVTAIASFALMILDALAFVIILIVTKIKNGGREK